MASAMNSNENIVCFSPELAGLLGGKLFDISEKGENKFALSTLEAKKNTQYNATLFPTVLLVGQMLAGKTTYAMSAIINGFIKADIVYWLTGTNDTDEMSNLSLRFKTAGIQLAYVHCPTAIITEQTLKVLDKIYSENNCMKSKCIVFDDMQDQLFNRTSPCYQQVVKVLAQWRHRNFTVMLMFQQFDYGAAQRKIVDLITHLVVFRLSTARQLLDYFKNNTNQIGDLTEMSTHRRGVVVRDFYIEMIENMGKEHPHFLMSNTSRTRYSRLRSDTLNKEKQFVYIFDNAARKYTQLSAYRKKGTEELLYEVNKESEQIQERQVQKISELSLIRSKYKTSNPSATQNDDDGKRRQRESPVDGTKTQRDETEENNFDTAKESETEEKELDRSTALLHRRKFRSTPYDNQRSNMYAPFEHERHRRRGHTPHHLEDFETDRRFGQYERQSSSFGNSYTSDEDINELEIQDRTPYRTDFDFHARQNINGFNFIS